MLGSMYHSMKNSIQIKKNGGLDCWVGLTFYVEVYVEVQPNINHLGFFWNKESC